MILRGRFLHAVLAFFPLDKFAKNIIFNQLIYLFSSIYPIIMGSISSLSL